MNYIKAFFIAIIISMSTLQGCGKSEADGYLKVNRMFSGLKSYTVDAEIIVRGNLASENYKVRQYFKYPDRYRLEVISPSDKTGKVTVCDGERLYIYHPAIDQTYVIEKYREVEEGYMFPGYFAKNLFTGEDAVYGTVKSGADKYISIRAGIPGGNNYRRWQTIYIDSSTINPVKMELLDKDQNAAVTIIYKNFIYNAKIDEKLFAPESLNSGQGSGQNLRQ